MANKAIQYGFQGLNQDTAKSLYRNSFYFDANNIRIVSTDTQATGAVMNERGNKYIYNIPIPTINYETKVITYGSKTLDFTTEEISAMAPGQPGPQYIIGHVTTRHYAVIFTSDENGFDCIWKINIEKPGYEITLLYMRNMLFSRDNPIQALNNFENKIIDKVYWIDGVHQLRYINIEHSLENEDLESLIDVPLSTIDMVGQYDISQPVIARVLTGGTHTAGMIQYAYNLYRVNSSQTRLSPLSQLISLDKDVLGGGALNEVVGSTPVISVRNIDEDYTHIKVYAIKYTSYNQSPTISIIDDREIPVSREIEVFDDGSVISAVSLEEFLFLGSDILVPQHINSKDNRLFMANYEERNYSVDLDVRAYSFNNSGSCTVYDNVKLFLPGDLTPDIMGLTGTPTLIDPVTYANDERNDSINLDYDTYKFNTNGTTYGGEGLYLKYELRQTEAYSPNSRYFKDEEIYRLGIEFINGFGQYSLPKWIADFKTREGNLRGFYNILSVTLKPAFFDWLNTFDFETEYDKPVGYRVLIAERTINDRTIVANGLVTPMMILDKDNTDRSLPNSGTLNYLKGRANQIPKLSNFLFRNIGPFFNDFSRHFGPNTRPFELAQNLQEMCNDSSLNPETPDREIQRAAKGDRDTQGRFYQYNAMYQLYSPEIIFGESVQLSTDYKFRMKGGLNNKYNTVWGKTFKTDLSLNDEGKGLNGLSLSYSESLQSISGTANRTTANGLICHPPDNSQFRVPLLSWYRGYGNVNVNDAPTSDSFIIPFTVPFIVTSGTMPAVPPYPNPAIQFQNNNKSVSMITVDDNRKLILTYTLTPTNNLVNYTASLSTDSNGVNIVNSFTGTGPSTVLLPPANQVKDDFGASYTTYNYYLKIVPSGDMVFDIDIHAEIQDVSGSPVLVGADSLNNTVSVLATPIAPPSDTFKKSTTQLEYDVYGIPEITIKGQNAVSYNRDNNYKYINTFLDILTDRSTHFDEPGVFGRAIVSGNCDANRSLTFVLGSSLSTTNWYDRPVAEKLFDEAQFGSGITNLGMVGEIVKSREQIYLGSIYGGNSWEDKKRTKYVEIGDFKNFDALTPVNLIVSPGDTFVNYFKFLRVVPKTPASIVEGVCTWQEIVEFYTETTIDIKNRNDESFSTWDSKFHYLDAEYHKYNKVYSQLPNLVAKRELDFNVKKVDGFDTNVIASKEKSAGEIVDSWTDILPNEVITLDGKYGAINALVSFNDYLYAIQDKAFAFLSINPRVQVQGQDGINIELGTGNVLNNYTYASTNSGTLNKWGVAVTPTSVYYYDTLNQSFNVFKGGIEALSDTKGLHTFFINNIVSEDILEDNPLLLKGIASTYDYINDDVLFTYHQPSGKSFTLSYNENTQSFVSFYDYLPTTYISKGSVLIAVDPTDLKLYRQYEGKYNEFFGTKYKSSITFNVNPEPLLDCVFDNINFKSEAYNSITNLDVSNITLSRIRAYNDYQDSGYENLVLGRNNNLRRKFRDWNALVPREGRNRIRAPWIKLEVDFDQTYNNPGNIDLKLILHPLNVYYTI